MDGPETSIPDGDEDAGTRIRAATEAGSEHPRFVRPLAGRGLEVLLSPGRLFEVLRHDPRAWSAVALGAALVSIANLAVPLDVWEETIRMRVLSAGAEAPTDFERLARLGRTAGALGAVVAWPALIALAAGFFAVLFLFGLGYEGNYRQYFSITAHSMLVSAFAAVLLVPLRIVAQDAAFSLTLAPILPAPEGSVFARFGELADLFHLWSYGLIGFGAAVLDGSRSRGTSAGLAVGAAVLTLLLLAAILP